jgi:N-methylhydantoinase B/oxoprolinase/acetone carboxylase alpha subunit
MKKLFVLSSVATVILLTACKQPRYYDLTAGRYVALEEDEKTGLMVNPTTREPVYMYVDTRTNDTIYGATGKVINGYVIKTSDGKYKFDEEEYKVKNDDYKKKVEGDEAKVKTDDNKIKTDEEEKKVKNDN